MFGVKGRARGDDYALPSNSFAQGPGLRLRIRVKVRIRVEIRVRVLVSDKIRYRA
jgi:hypothetical protein